MSQIIAAELLESQAVCPHCWHNFYPDHAWYIARHPSLVGDPILDENAATRFAPKDVKRDASGCARDPRGAEMLERACPRCHLQIPSELLERRPKLVSLVGAPQTGKTYFLTSLVHALRTELPRNFGYSWVDSDSHDVRAFREYETLLFHATDPSKPVLLKKTEEVGDLYNHPKLNGAPVSLPKPFIFSLQPTQDHPDLAQCADRLRSNFVLYDNAGESFHYQEEAQRSQSVTHHLTECDAVMFAFDPLQDIDTRQRLASGSRDPQLSREWAKSNRQDAILTETVNRIRKLRRIPSNARIPVPLVVCVQKYDVWKQLVPYQTIADAKGRIRPTIDHSSTEFITEQGVAGLDREEINWISLLVRAVVESLCPDFAAWAESQFSVVRYFPVSALGVSPHVHGAQLMVTPKDIRPFRVSTPLLWLLEYWRLIRRIRPDERNPSRYQHASIQQVTEDRLRILSPTTRRPVVLDWQYAGTTTIDPTCGQFIWIPPAPGTVPPPRAIAAPAARPPLVPGSRAPKNGVDLSKLGLQLDPPPKPPKRSWFGRS